MKTVSFENDLNSKYEFLQYCFVNVQEEIVTLEELKQRSDDLLYNILPVDVAMQYVHSASTGVAFFYKQKLARGGVDQLFYVF